MTAAAAAPHVPAPVPAAGPDSVESTPVVTTAGTAGGTAAGATGGTAAGTTGSTAAGTSATAAAGTGTGIGAGLYRSVMRQHAKGVAVITAGEDTAPPHGFCATSLTSVSLDPPLVSFTVGLHAASWPAVEAARHVAVHLLTDAQEDTARRFAHGGPAKFGRATRWHRGAHGLPVLDDALASLIVSVVQVMPVGDHALVIGRVVEAALTPAPARPLIHHDGAFAHLAFPSDGP
ncbi:NADH-FMN oxidoreductase RutF, flavin reductase (DIM6/NTAB) family [Actinacidiphila alni]|uniref:NADH-FMN oxidoreductase RutF, flavin reductase (DIM6/NTAB) family n=1 Tax=Actinacidiphila alni TaxID=380248 RepID=A0A1I2ITK7_9ACTN|nr:flavin reductase family protein [Actinacidiphila alni]SFF44968.1 NADH-FMN oxidoreductase RutF, flavin reductase (DIM6/NTAB) family [Actinacidiphila alni]